MEISKTRKSYSNTRSKSTPRSQSTRRINSTPIRSKSTPRSQSTRSNSTRTSQPKNTKKNYLNLPTNMIHEVSKFSNIGDLKQAYKATRKENTEVRHSLKKELFHKVIQNIHNNKLLKKLDLRGLI